METLILGWYVLVETQSVFMLTVFASLQYLGTLLAPMFGVVGDRIGHRNLLCGMRGLYATLATILMSLAFLGLVTPAIIPYRRDGEAGVLRFLERACPDYLIVFPAWFPTLTAMRERFTPVERVRLSHNTVSGAEEMVVYETEWSRGHPAPRACEGGVASTANRYGRGNAHAG